MPEPFVTRLCAAVADGLAAIDMPPLLAAASRVAAQLQDGGRLFAGGSADFVSEAVVRGGGLMIVEAWSAEAGCGPQDAVLVSWTGEEDDATRAELLGSLVRSGAAVVGVGPALPLGLPADTPAGSFVHLVAGAPGLERVADALTHPYPLTSLQSVATLWVFTAELVGALTRLGLMPCVYQSVLVDGARRRNDAHQQASGGRFEPNDHRVPPQPPESLGAAFVADLTQRLGELGSTAASPIAAAATACAAARAKGGTLHAYLIGHFPVHQSGRPGDPGVLAVLEDGRHGELPSEEELQTKLRAGNAFLHFGYYRRPRACYERCREAGVEVAFESIATGGAALSELSADTGEVTRAVPEEGWGADEPEPTVSIDCRFPLGDGVVSVQGHDVAMCPVSALLQAVVFWAMSCTIHALEAEAAGPAAAL